MFYQSSWLEKIYFPSHNDWYHCQNSTMTDIIHKHLFLVWYHCHNSTMSFLQSTTMTLKARSLILSSNVFPTLWDLEESMPLLLHSRWSHSRWSWGYYWDGCWGKFLITLANRCQKNYYISYWWLRLTWFHFWLNRKLELWIQVDNRSIPLTFMAGIFRICPSLCWSWRLLEFRVIFSLLWSYLSYNTNKSSPTQRRWRLEVMMNW